MVREVWCACVGWCVCACMNRCYNCTQMRGVKKKGNTGEGNTGRQRERDDCRHMIGGRGLIQILNERGYRRVGKLGAGDKNFVFWEIHFASINFYRSTMGPPWLMPDTWGRRERYK